MEEENPLVRIADTLERIACMLEKMANPPMMVRGIEQTIEFTENGSYKIT